MHTERVIRRTLGVVAAALFLCAGSAIAQVTATARKPYNVLRIMMKIAGTNLQAIDRVVVVTLSLFATGAVTALHAAPIKVAGTGAAMAAMGVLADEFKKSQPDADILVLPAIGSGGAIKGVKGGEIDVGVSGRALRENERSGKIEEAEFARTPFVFVVAKTNPVAGLSESELTDIYAGKRTSWPDGSRLRLVMRPTDDSDALVLKTRFSPAMKEAVQAAERRPGMLFAATDQDCADMLERTPGAFGPLTLGQIVAERRSLKALALEGVTPGVEAAADGSYRYAKALYLLIAPDARPIARKFHAFVRSARGRELLRQLGFWSVSERNAP